MKIRRALPMPVRPRPPAPNFETTPTHGGLARPESAYGVRAIAIPESQMTPTLYGIPNCDTVKKARVWLDEHGRAFTFHDYKKAGIDRASLEGWVAQHGWEIVLNRNGTTFKALDAADKDGLDAEKAIGLMLAQPSMIKRPVLVLGEEILVGFKPGVYGRAMAPGG